jgi:hypothetical protein
VIEVECNPDLYGTGSKIKITASQLFSRCKGDVSWYVPNPFRVAEGRGVTLELDADGNASVALLAGPGCAAGESLVSAHMEESPFETFTTSFTVLPPNDTAPGVFALPAAQVEDALSSSVATVIQTEFGDASEKRVHIGSEELFARCRVEPHLHWVRMNREIEDASEVEGVELDNNGNAFVIAIGDASCAEGPSLIEADLESKPFTTFTTTFTVLPPQPTEEPSFTIEKRQEIAGSAGGFTTAPLTGKLGQTVRYEIIVKNTANVPETFSQFVDKHCDAGTLAGGPGASPVTPGNATTYTCSHVLTALGNFTNEATVTGTSVGGAPLTKTSNQVVVLVLPPETEHASTPVKPGPSSGVAGVSQSTPAGAEPKGRGAAKPRCEASPLLRGASGPKRGTFMLEVSSRGVKQITFYLDGRKLQTLTQPQARHGKFTLKLDPRKLAYGAHKVSIKTVMSNPNCASIARSSVFVRPHTEHAPPTFTG